MLVLPALLLPEQLHIENIKFKQIKYDKKFFGFV